MTIRLTAEQRYRQAMAKVRIRSHRNIRLAMEGKIDYIPGANERGAIIDELERAYQAGLADGLAKVFVDG